MTRKLTLVALIWLVVATFVVPTPFAADERPGAEELYNSAEALYESGAYEEALSRFRAFVLRYYNSPRSDDAYLHIARIFRHQGKCDDALLYLQRIPKNRQTSAARLIDGVCQIELNHDEVGLKQLRSLYRAEFGDADSALLFGTLSRAEKERGRLLSAVAFAWRTLEVPGEHNELLGEVHRVLENQVSEEELKEIRYMFSDSAIGQDAGLQLARRALARRDEATARVWLNMVLTSPEPFPYRTDAESLMSRLDGEVDLQRDAIGVLLPLSGRYKVFGELVKRGMDLALKLHNDTHAPVRFLYKDTQGDPLVATRQMGVLVNEDRVMAVAGPLTGAAAESVGDRAGSEAVPMLTFSQKTGLPQKNRYVFRNSLTAQLQARALARYAVEERGLKSFGILHPENKFGRTFAYLFAREVSRLGGLVIAAESYSEKDTDFRRPIKHLVGLDPDEKQERPKRLSKEQELEDLFVPEEMKLPPVPFEALFIPDYADKVGLVTPQLAFYGLEDTPLLGINGWNSPDLVRLAGRNVEGAVFVDGFFRQSQMPFVKEFVDLYFETYKEEPSILEAQAFDVAGILLDLLDRPKLENREDLRDALNEMQNYPGVTGATSFDRDGEADKILFLLQVKKGSIVQIN